MASRAAELGGYIARACFPKPKVDEALEIKYNKNGKPVVYKRRWLILAAFCLGYFVWNLHGYRQTPLIAEYALYFDRTNEFQPPPELGIDFMVIADNFYLLFFYPLGGKLVDKYGIRMMSLGAILQAASTWWWYLSFEDYTSVLISKILASFSGVLIATSLLRITNNWFSQDQRALAVAIGSIVATLGAGAALIVGPFFSTGEAQINFDLKSCVEDFQDNFNASGDVTSLDCSPEAQEKFCCVTETDIDLYNLFLALIASAVAVYTVLVVRDSPPTPPSRAGTVTKGPSIWKAMKIMFSRCNYTQICLADFVASGPPLVLFATIDRIFPPTVSEFSTIGAAVSLILAIPIAGVFSHFLSKTQKYYEMTAGGYFSGFVAWILATICVAVGTTAGDFAFLAIGSVALICFILWTASVYELKVEYVFSAKYAIQGYIVAVDRTVINLSSLIFVAAIPPERFQGGRISGRLFTFLVGAVFMFIGVIFVFTIRNKRAYLRKAFETETRLSFSEVQDTNEFFDNPEVKNKVDLVPEKTVSI